MDYSCFKLEDKVTKKEISAMKWAKDISRKHVDRMFIFMFVLSQSMLSYSQSELVLSIHSKGIKFHCFLI